MRVSNIQMFSGALNRILDLQRSTYEMQNQVATGKRIVSAADDPVAASAVLQIGERVAALDQFDRNGVQAGQRLQQVDDVMGGVTNVMQRARELLIQGRSEALNDGDRRAIAVEIREHLDVLVDLGNTRNSSGEYLFSGAQVTSRPFTRDTLGTVSYNGDQTVRRIQISESRSLPEGFTGDDVFFAIRNGNGKFVTAMGAGNTGTAQISDNVVVDPSAFQTHDYRIQFTSPTTYDVIDDSAGATLLSARPYVAGSAISFAGMEVTLFGEPDAGDAFTLTPSAHHSLFATLDDIATTLENGFDNPAEAARFGFELDRSIENLDMAVERAVDVRATTGARLASIDAQRNLHEDTVLNLRTLRSQLEDVDLAEAISLLSQQSTALEAAQATFVRLQGLSLFNFL